VWCVRVRSSKGSARMVQWYRNWPPIRTPSVMPFLSANHGPVRACAIECVCHVCVVLRVACRVRTRYQS